MNFMPMPMIFPNKRLTGCKISIINHILNSLSSVVIVLTGGACPKRFIALMKSSTYARIVSIFSPSSAIGKIEPFSESECVNVTICSIDRSRC